MRATASESPETLMADKLAAVGLNRWQNRLIAAIGEFLDHGGTVEEVVGLAFRVSHGETMPVIDDTLPELKTVHVDEHARRAPTSADIAQRQAKFENITKALFGIKLSDGRDVAEIGAHELPGMERDGALARELLKELPVLSGDDRFAKLGKLISKEKAEAARQRAERQTKKTK